MKAISVRQPWAWLLFHGKPVENRNWLTLYRGALAIHAAKGSTWDEYEAARLFVRGFDPELAGLIPHPESLIRGAVIGTVKQTGCVIEHPSPFFTGKYGHVYEEAHEFAIPIPAKGALGLWEWEGVFDAASVLGGSPLMEFSMSSGQEKCPVCDARAMPIVELESLANGRACQHCAASGRSSPKVETETSRSRRGANRDTSRRSGLPDQGVWNG